MNAGCTRCESPLEDGDLRCAICALPVPIAPQLRDATVRAQVLRCTECNAAISFSAEVQAPRCGFCNSTMKVEHPVDPIEIAELRIPFLVDRGTAEVALRGWLGTRGWFAPKTLKADAVLDSMVPLCWAGWIVNARAQIAWTADSDFDSHRAAWAPHAGQLGLSFDAICVPASRGLGHGECATLVPYYDLGRAVEVGAKIDGETPSGIGGSTGVSPVDGGTPSGMMIESFDAQRSAARAIVQRGIEAVAKTKVEPHIPGSRFRNVHVACLLERQTTRRVALPAWVLAYRYRGSAYRAIVHGQRPEIVFGNSPTDWKKVVALVGGILAVIAAIAAIIYFSRR
ncbi:MAG: zinc ribbon domain-containing protein [Deltaproteobacteria bacterium]|nr:zinc ribbon domain-containing protein [Deltaproteobacteria bacterium]